MEKGVGGDTYHVQKRSDNRAVEMRWKLAGVFTTHILARMKQMKHGNCEGEDHSDRDEKEQADPDKDTDNDRDKLAHALVDPQFE